jgi:hypothetical protein
MFDLELDIIGIDELEAAFARADDALVDVVADGVAAGLDDGAARARETHPYRDQTGALTSSIGARVEAKSPSGTSGVLEATAPYASYVEEGTDAHEIEAGAGGTLAWQDGGGTHFAKRVQHPGTQPMPFIQPAADYAGEQIAERIAAGVEARVKPILEK